MLDTRSEINTQNYKNNTKKMSMIATSKQMADTIETLKRHIRRLEDKNFELKQELKKYEKQK